MDSASLYDGLASGIGRLVDHGESLKKVGKLSRLSDLAQRVGEIPPGIPSGLAPLDRAIGGFVPGRVYIVGGYVANYKTGTAAWLTNRLALSGVPVAVFSCEMADTEFARILLRSGEASESIYVTGEVNTLAEIVEHTMAVSAKHDNKPVAAVIDYAQLIKGEHHDSREREVALVASGLSQFARRTGHIVISTAQINRAGAIDGKPQSWHLRESGALEMAADVVLISQLEGDRLKLRVTKNRWGAKDQEIEARVDFSTLTLSEVTVEEREAESMEELLERIENFVIAEGRTTVRAICRAVKMGGVHPSSATVRALIARPEARIKIEGTEVVARA